MLAAPLPNHRCPVCGHENDCAAAKSGSFGTPCWCYTIAIDPKAMAAVPETERGRACLCKRCTESLPEASRDR